MSVTVLVPSNTHRLTTLEAVMAEIHLGDAMDFADSLIDQASAAVARHCGVLTFAQQAYRELITPVFRGPYLLVKPRPLLSVSSVGYGTTLYTDYRIASHAGGMLYRARGWRVWPYWDEEWSVDFISGFILPEQALANTPDPTGWTLREMGADLERATLETIKVWFHEQFVETRIESRRLGDQSISYGVQARRTGIPVLAKDLLQPWMQMRIA